MIIEKVIFYEEIQEIVLVILTLFQTNMATLIKNYLYCFKFILFALMSILTMGNNEDLYRLVGRGIICDSQSIIKKVTAYSLSNCAMACKMKQDCEMFSIDHVFSNKSITMPISKKNVKFICALCRSTNMTTMLDMQGWSTYMVSPSSYSS